MGYQPKIIRGKVKGTGYPIDGRELLFSLWDYDNYESYHLSGWRDDDDEAVMLTIHQSEEEARICVYDTLEDFASAWEEGEYEAEGAFCLAPDNVDVLEIIQEEKQSSMDRLTVKVLPNDKDYALKCMCSFARNGEVDDVDSCEDVCSLRDGGGNKCDGCGFQEAFNRLAAYENTGLTPNDITALTSDNARLHKLLEEFTDTLRKDGTSQ